VCLLLSQRYGRERVGDQDAIAWEEKWKQRGQRDDTRKLPQRLKPAPRRKTSHSELFDEPRSRTDPGRVPRPQQYTKGDKRGREKRRGHVREASASEPA